MCIYDASLDAPFGFCCDVDAETSRELSGLFLGSFLVCTGRLIIQLDIGSAVKCFAFRPDDFNLICLNFCIAGLQGVLSVKPDPDFSSAKKDYSFSNIQLGGVSNSHIGSTQLFSAGNSKHWLVQMNRPTVGVVTKAQMVDFYAQILTKVLGKLVLIV